MADFNSGHVPPEDEKALEGWFRPQSPQTFQEPILEHTTPEVNFHHNFYALQLQRQGPSLPAYHSEEHDSSLYRSDAAAARAEHDFESIGSQYDGTDSYHHNFHLQQPHGGEYQGHTELSYPDPEYDTSFDVSSIPASAYPSTSERSGDVDYMEMSNIAEASIIGASFERSVPNPDIMIYDVGTLNDWNNSPPSMDFLFGNTTRDGFSPYDPGSGSYPVSVTPDSSRSVELLGVPCSSYQAKSPSPTPSAVSTTPSNVLEELKCPYENCDCVFTGKHRRGNLQRHIRLKHRGETARSYPCGIHGCMKIYMRQDGLLKHQRNKHPSVFV